VVTVNSVGKKLSELPFTAWYDVAPLAYEYSSPIADGPLKQYIWASTTGLRSAKGETFTPSSGGTITGNYRKQATVYATIQTDKPIYGFGQNVYFYIYGLQFNAVYTVSITRPDGVIDTTFPFSGTWQGTPSRTVYYVAPSIVGIYKAVVMDSTPDVVSNTAEFRVYIQASYTSRSGLSLTVDCPPSVQGKNVVVTITFRNSGSVDLRNVYVQFQTTPTSGVTILEPTRFSIPLLKAGTTATYTWHVTYTAPGYYTFQVTGSSGTAYVFASWMIQAN